MRNMFFTASMNRFMLFCAAPFYFPAKTFDRLSRGQDLERGSRRGDLFFGRRAESVRVNGDFGGQLAVSEDLDAVFGAADEAVRAKQVRRHRFAGREDVQLFQI